MKASVEGMPVEAIASDYTISDDALVHTFTLRRRSFITARM